MIYTLTLNPAVDYHMTVERLCPDITNAASGTSVHFGGKGINVSRVLGELGVPSVALGFVAGFTGDALEADLRARGLTTDFIRLPAGMTRINVKVWGKDEETELNAPGPDVPPACMEVLEARLAQLGAEDTLVMAGRIPPSLASDTYAQLADLVAPRGVRVVVDASRAALLAVLPFRPFLIKPNLAELEDTLGRVLRLGDGSPDPVLVAEAAAELQARGARHVLVTLGKHGAFLLDAEGQGHRLSAPAGRIVDTVGAGDSTVAGFLCGVDRGMDSVHALRLAVAAGSATAMSEGLTTRERIERMLSLMAAD